MRCLYMDMELATTIRVSRLINGRRHFYQLRQSQLKLATTIRTSNPQRSVEGSSDSYGSELNTSSTVKLAAISELTSLQKHLESSMEAQNREPAMINVVLVFMKTISIALCH
ncbi:uncharacterized protein LOC110929829 [Helianthus annuus]|uniref:uncharacterized protein LOC110929829 n=1 Tax=Helianthus annuus TaxID=4232 RepID=UPI000B8F2B04|nr:uncharacterized protein LOC110929829 [Helianthus annuus]